MSRITTPAAILSYPALFEPKVGMDGGSAKYGCALVFEAGTDLSGLEVAAMEAARAKWGDKAASMKLRMPFRPDDEGKYGAPRQHIYINVRSDYQPGIVDGQLNTIGPARSNEIYAGCKVRASLNAYAYDTKGNRGVTFGLNNVQKLGDGKRLDGRRAAEHDFEALPVADLEAAAADLI